MAFRSRPIFSAKFVRIQTVGILFAYKQSVHNRGKAMQRRQLFQAATAAAILTAVAAPRARAATKSKPKIIMVHGSWHWGGCFP
jgi:hypothetical protein